ncbi:MAG: HU family DNA-binding protein [Gammaproteobacteria bacterium]|nr:HU family DNA-binding protein [Gammaproteobacteria bacterium]
MAAKKKAKAKPKKAKASSAEPKPPTKSEIYTTISEQTELSRKQVASVFDALSGLIEKNLKSRGPGFFTLPGLLKIKVIKKPATKARKGINPFTGEEMVFKAKPARKAVKVLPLKALKEMP